MICRRLINLGEAIVARALRMSELQFRRRPDTGVLGAGARDTPFVVTLPPSGTRSKRESVVTLALIGPACKLCGREPAEAGVRAALKRWTRDINSRIRISDHHHFEDRRRRAPVLACLLAGYKSELWPRVLPRFKAALPAGADVCVVTPGLRSGHFADLCRREGWSYLSIATNEVALAQNVCYRLHDRAEIIVKIDEDMFLTPGGVATLVAEHRRIKSEGIVDPGFVAPMIP